MPPAVSCRGSGTLMPDVFGGGCVDRIFGNIRSVVAYPLEMSANKHQIQITAQLLRIVRHSLD